MTEPLLDLDAYEAAAGAAAVLGLLATRFEAAMALCGACRVGELTCDLVAWRHD